MVESQDEYARIRRLHPAPDEEGHPAASRTSGRRVDTFLRNNQAELDTPLSPGKAVQGVSTSGTARFRMDSAGDANRIVLRTTWTWRWRLYDLHVAPPHRESRVGAPGSRPRIRTIATKLAAGRTVGKVRKSVRVDEFTSPATRCASTTATSAMAPGLCRPERFAGSCGLQNFAYTVDRIASSAAFGPSLRRSPTFPLLRDNARHQFVSNTLRGSGIEAVRWKGLRYGSGSYARRCGRTQSATRDRRPVRVKQITRPRNNIICSFRYARKRKPSEVRGHFLS